MMFDPIWVDLARAQGLDVWRGLRWSFVLAVALLIVLVRVVPVSAAPGDRVIISDAVAAACTTQMRAADLVAVSRNVENYQIVLGSFERAKECTILPIGTQAIVIEDTSPVNVVRVRVLPNGPDVWVDIVVAYGAEKAKARLESWFASQKSGAAR